MSVTLAMLVLDPPIDRLVALVELCRPTISDIVIVVDDRTNDYAKHIMSTWKDTTLVPFTWINDFSTARNAALGTATGKWILHLDPDEVPTEAMLAHVRHIDTVGGPMGVLFMTENWWGGGKGEWNESDWHCRLFQRAHGIWYKPVHEQVMIDGQLEAQTRSSEILKKAPREAWLIHSKPQDAIDRDSTLYATIERSS